MEARELVFRIFSNVRCECRNRTGMTCFQPARRWAALRTAFFLWGE
jgi:hypothetical protein